MWTVEQSLALVAHFAEQNLVLAAYSVEQSLVLSVRFHPVEKRYRLRNPVVRQFLPEQNGVAQVYGRPQEWRYGFR